jgi:hypothetical protein
MESIPRRRRRPALSCIECRRRKIKCDRAEPCTHCKASRSQCSYRIYSRPVVQQNHGHRQQERYPSAWESTTSPSVLAMSPVVEHSRDGVDRSAATAGNRESAVQPVYSAPSIRNSDSHGSPRVHNAEVPNLGKEASRGPSQAEFQALQQQIKRLEAIISSKIEHDSEQRVPTMYQDLLVRQSGLQDAQIGLTKTRVLRWNHWSGMATEEVFTALTSFYSMALTQSLVPAYH